MSGTGGAISPPTKFSYNNFYTASGTPHAQYTPANNGYSPSSNNPIKRYWLSIPKGDSNHGGTYETCSQCSSLPTSAQVAASTLTTDPAKSTYSLPPGIPAILPPTPATTNVNAAVTTNAPLITADDVKQFVTTNDFPSGPTISGTQKTVEEVSLIPAKEASLRLQGESIGRPDSTLVYYVQVKGPLSLQNASLAPGAHLSPNQTAATGVEIFDAQTGNLLLWHVEG